MTMVSDPIAFPLSPYVEFYIPASFITIIIQLQILGLVFYRSKIFQKSSQFTSQVYSSFGFLTLGNILGFISISLDRFLDWNLIHFWSNDYLYHQGWYFFSLGGFIAILIMERIFEATMKVPYIYSIMSLILLMVSILNWNSPLFDIFTLMVFLLVNFFMFTFWIRLWSKSSPQLKRYLVELLWGLGLSSLNLIFAHREFLVFVQSETVYLLLYIGQLCGHILLFHALFHIKTLNDADWRSSIYEIHIISRSDRKSILYQNFQHLEDPNKELYASSIFAIESLLNVLDSRPNNSQEIERIDWGEYTLIVRYEAHLIGILTVSSKFLVYEKLLTRILKEFEYDYHHLIQQDSLSLSKNQERFHREFLERIYQIIYA
ncbi:MAG: hypothetical protein ACTSYI_16580 [Promethearchaeota archaeon]